MIFNRLAYFALFLIPSALLFRRATPAWRPWICAAFGMAFFVYFSLTELGGVVAASTVAILIWEALFSRLYRPGARIAFAGIAITIAVLAVFKYWNFITGLVTLPLGANPFRWEGAFLPLGISFFTFEFIHYAVDRYKGRTEPGTIGEYLAFIFFFPTMVAGPIKRYQDFLPSIRHPSTDAAADWNRGTTRILAGLVKKFGLADLLSSVSDNLNGPAIAQADRASLVVWLLAYSGKIYFDFSAYSDIAIGSARLFGITVPENFDWPYFRRNIADFWRHWHMSLYKWLVDYVFIPLGGSRGTVARVCVNSMLVMLVSGIWHGAGVNFVIWGAWHGLLLVTHRLWVTYRDRLGTARPPLWFSDPASRIGTFVAVTLGWSFFAMDVDTALLYLGRLFGGR